MFWLYLRRNHHYYFVRNMLFAAMGIALIGYMLFPTAPPRMLTDLGFTDTLEKFASVNHDSGAVISLSNPFAAVPSVHTCFSLIIGTTCFFLVRRRALRVAWLFYPALIVFSIVATANHFWLDAILGAAVAFLALGIAWLIERRRPTLPALGPAPAASRIPAPPSAPDRGRRPGRTEDSACGIVGADDDVLDRLKDDYTHGGRGFATAPGGRRSATCR